MSRTSASAAVTMSREKNSDRDFLNFLKALARDTMGYEGSEALRGFG